MKYKEIDQVTRWYPTEFRKLSGDEIFKVNETDMYIHIPFCLGKCAFCPFNSKPINKQNLGEYFGALTEEINNYANEPLFKYKKITALWIGGGTPSAVPFEYIKEVLDLVMSKFQFDNNAEITLETNLHDLKENYIKSVEKTRINRLSIGIQSFVPKYLNMMGRTYSDEWIEEFFSFIGNYNLTISIDLMFRYPGQTIEDVQEEIQLIGKYSDNIDHITLYGLILFPKLGIYKRIKDGKLPKQPSLKKYETMSQMFTEQLQKYGFYKYTSNHFAKFGKENRYNNDRWGFPQKECISFGSGAFGQINGYIYCNEHKVEDYFEKIKLGVKPIQSGKKINLIEQASRYLVLGTRLREIDLSLYEELTGINPLIYYKIQIEQLIADGLIRIEADKLLITDKGFTYTVDVNAMFQTQNNLEHTQPQYEILDMFEGNRAGFASEVIELEE